VVPNLQIVGYCALSIKQLAMELTMRLHGIDVITRLWNLSPDEDKRGMAQHMFEAITYDLDKQEIVDFRLKEWAGKFMRLRIALHADDQSNKEDYDGRRMTPTGLEPVFWP
jgi:hypothetical protein